MSRSYTLGEGVAGGGPSRPGRVPGGRLNDGDMGPSVLPRRIVTETRPRRQSCQSPRGGNSDPGIPAPRLPLQDGESQRCPLP